MATPFADEAALAGFLADPRLATLMTNREGGAPMGVPVWFEWTGSEVLMFAAAGSAKLKRIERDPNISVLVTNHVGEPEAWIAFDGRVSVSPEDASDLIGRLGARYWDLSHPEKRQTLESWQAAKEAFVLLRLTPERIRSGQ